MNILPLLLAATASLNTQAPTASAQPRFKANTNLVIVDVVVTDKDGHPVHDLKSQDFTVLEDGKQQSIIAFQEQRPDAAPKLQPASLHLLKNEYSNYVERTDPGALTVILFDSLNTDPQNLTYARGKLLNFLKKLPPGKRVALYTLGSELRMVQSFTDSSDDLIAAAQQLSAQRHPLYSNNREMSASIAELKEMDLTKNPQAYRAMVRFLATDYAGKLDTRAQNTLDALTQLARSIAAVPGRKNLIWMSGGFPFNIAENSERLQKVSALLAANRIAVYPVDVRGVVQMAAEGQTRSKEIYAPAQTQSYETIAGLDAENMSLVQTMKNAAEFTGGRAYVNNNDLEHAIADSMETGSNYYSLAYRPTNTDWNGRFRKITVKTTHANVQPLYRSGYYAVRDSSRSKGNPDRAAALAMQPEAPISTQLIMKARVVPPDDAEQPAAIDMLIDLHDLVLSEEDNRQKYPDVQFIAVAWDGKGKACATFSKEFHQPLSPAQLQSLLRTGLQVHQLMALKPGTYQLRLGVMDRLADRIGTLDVPLVIREKGASNESR